MHYCWLHVPCAVQGFNVMPLEQVPNEGILFQPLFQSGKFLRSLRSAKLLWVPSESSPWRECSPHLTTSSLDCSSLWSWCSLASLNWFRLSVDGWLRTKDNFCFMLISVNLIWCIQLWARTAPAQPPVPSCRQSRPRRKSCIELFINN